MNNEIIVIVEKIKLIYEKYNTIMCNNSIWIFTCTVSGKKKKNVIYSLHALDLTPYTASVSDLCLKFRERYATRSKATSSQ